MRPWHDLSLRKWGVSYTRDEEYFLKIWSFYEPQIRTYCPEWDGRINCHANGRRQTVIHRHRESRLKRNNIVKTEINEKKVQRRRKHCALAVVKWNHKFSPRRRPLPGGAGQPKFNQLEMVTTFTYKPSLVRIDARNFELSRNRPTHTHKHRPLARCKHAHRQGR